MLARDWLAAFPLRFALIWIYLSYEYVKYAVYVLIAFMVILIIVSPDFSPREYTLPQPLADNLAYLAVSLPGFLVIAFMLRAMLRNDGPWSNRPLRRRILHVARTRNPEEAVSMIEDALLTDPHDRESSFLLVQLYAAAGRFGDAIKSILPLREEAPEQYLLWTDHIRYLQVLGESSGLSDDDFDTADEFVLPEYSD